MDEPAEYRDCPEKSCKRRVGPYYEARQAEVALSEHIAYGHLKKAQPAPPLAQKVPDWLKD